MDGSIRLVKHVASDGYEIRPLPKISHQPELHGAPAIFPKGTENKLIVVNLGEANIYRDLLNTTRVPGYAGLLPFMNRFGPLSRRSPRLVSHSLSARDVFATVVLERKKEHVGELFKLAQGGPGPLVSDLGLLGIRLHQARTRWRLIFETADVLQFCVLEWLHERLAGIDLTACGYCGILLPAHHHGRPSKYCSLAHKTAAWRRDNPAEVERINCQRREQRAVQGNRKRIGQKSASKQKRPRAKAAGARSD